jgi:hypothetical protein
MAREHHAVAEAIGMAFQTAWERVCAILALGAISLPAWHPTLHETSETAAQLAPILGCIWLIVQIGARLWELRRPQRAGD